MSFQYTGIYWLKNGSEFRFPEMSEYIACVRESMKQPLQAPEFAAAGEGEKLAAASKVFQDNPWKLRRQFNQGLEQIQQDFTAAELVSYGSYRNLYGLCLFAVRAVLGPGIDPMIYTAKFVYNANAVCYLNKVWIYISDYFFRDMITDRDIDMFCEEELVALVGHELGHAACRHTMLKMAGGTAGAINYEYSADRAGLLACTKYLMDKNPGLSYREAAEKAVIYMVSMLKKIDAAVKAVPKKDIVDWHVYNQTAFQNAQETVEGIFLAAVPANPYRAGSTHPIDIHRTRALVYFSESELFCRCLGLDPSAFPNLRSDKMLQNDMSGLLIG